MKQPTKYKWSIALTSVVALIYVLLPADFVPDAVPALGWIDDIVAILLAIANAIRLTAKIKKTD